MPQITDSRWLTTATWDDVPHLDEKTKKELLDATPPFLRDARSKGIPSRGSGAIYPIDYGEVSVKPFPIPAHWPKAYALDVGWNMTAALWAAWDEATSTCYVYAEHYRGKAEPIIHARAIQARGEWMKGVIDPAANGRAQADGRQLMQVYRGLGLKLVKANNEVEAGLYRVWVALSEGRLKLFNNLSNLEAEYNLYRRDENGRIVKKMDHLMDTLRYLMNSGRARASVKPVPGGIVNSATPAADRRAGY